MKKPLVLVAPLHWGLGHATRCVPIIKCLKANGTEVIVAATGNCAAFFKIEMPEVEIIDCPSPTINYGNKFLLWNLFLQLPKLFKSVSDEHKFLDQLIQDRKIDAVISDNRYGMYSKKIPSVFITHQLHIKAGIFSSLVNYINHKCIKRFKTCWIPDHQGLDNLSGELSNPLPKGINGFYVGPLSRFKKDATVDEKKYDVVFINSGPEPQRSFIEEIILGQCESIDLKMLILRGLPESNERKAISPNITIADHLVTKDLNEVLINCDIVIARSGYSTVMDLSMLNKKAGFIPTPGQTEQEYIAEYLKDKNIAPYHNQQDVNLKRLIEETSNYNGFSQSEQDLKLDRFVKELIRSINPF